AAELVEHYRDGIWLVELAALTDPALLPSAVASALGVREQPGQALTQSLLDYLRARRLLLILDNCEHLLEACATLTNAILHACPRGRVVPTGGGGLGVAGDALHPVPSLPLPAGPERSESVPACESGRLFVARARAALPQFEATAQNAAALAQICRRLDGI